MNTRLSNRSDASEEGRSATHTPAAAQLRNAPAAAMSDVRAESLMQLRHQERASNSTRSAQLKACIKVMAGHGAEAPVQRVAEEELLQGKFAVAQREEDEDLLQGRFALVQRMEDEELLQGKFNAQPIAQLKEKTNNTGMSNQLKAGIESLSGMSMDHVRVYYNSGKPAQLNAHAYAQGSEIHMAPGQEQHLPHEAWHVVQQMQGRVKPTMQMKGDVPVNDDVGLEREADVMGALAITMGTSEPSRKPYFPHNHASVRQNRANRVVTNAARKHYSDGWGEQYQITDDTALIAKVATTVQGTGSIPLGTYEAPDAEVKKKQCDPFEKKCSIEYVDGDEPNTTVITHCGPSGSPEYF